MCGRYHLDDIIPIGNGLFVPVNFSEPTDLLRLKYVGKSNRIHGDSPGSIAKNIKTKDLHGNTFILSKLHGHYVLWDFWFIGCSPCKATLPGLKKLNQRYGKEGLNITSIALPVELAKLPDDVSKNNMNWTNIVSSSSNKHENITNSYRIQDYPTFILIDPTGKIVLRELGPAGFEKINRYISKVLSHYK